MIGFACVAAGAVCLIYAASVRVRGLVWQQSRSGLYAGTPAPAEAAADTPLRCALDLEPAAAPAPQRGEAVGRLRVPRAGIDVVVAEGTDVRTLSLGPGHMEGTAWPGEPDNCIIAGHRDGPFGRLRSVTEGDLIEIAGDSGLSRYRVLTTEIVDRHDTSPLASADEPLLTLVTCYPFNYVGAAPQRFIVRAALVRP